MNKSELIDIVSARAGLTKKDAAAAIEAVFDNITANLEAGDEVRLVGFGTFATADRTARPGRNPRTGAKITIPASTLPTFKAGKSLKSAVNAGPRAHRRIVNPDRSRRGGVAALGGPHGEGEDS